VLAALVAVAAPGVVVGLAAAAGAWEGVEHQRGGRVHTGPLPRQVAGQHRPGAHPSLLALGAILVVVAVLVGVLVATRLARPFAELAEAANALARGRFDLRLPATRVAEARAISEALEGAADQLRGSLERERDLALRASHELRTPLTSLSLALHDLVDRDDAPADLVEAAALAARTVERLDRAVGDVLEETRNHPVVPGAHLPLSLVVPALAQRWADTLALAGVGVEVELLGDASLALTPGPLEQVLDDVLLAVLGQQGQQVRLTVEGAERHLRVTVRVEGSLSSSADAPALERARGVVATLGGRTSGDTGTADGLVVVLPRR
jgi:signal transduction histidine kinase